MDFRSYKFRDVASVLIFVLALLSSSGCASLQSAFSPGPLSASISVSPNNASVKVASTLKFTASVSNTSNKSVTWHVNGVPGGDRIHGTIASDGTYHAPSVPPSPATISIMAVLNAHPDKAATATVVVVAPEIIVSVTPTLAEVQVGKTQSIIAVVQNDALNSGVTWRLSGLGCSGVSCGTISSASSASDIAIIYTAPRSVSATTSVKLIATSVADTTKSADVTITITTAAPPPPPPPSISVLIDPTATAVLAGKSQKLTAIVENDAQNKGVIWTLSGPGCSGAACGTLSATASASGTAISFTAPASAPSPAVATVTATSVSDPSKSATSNITITNPPTSAIAVFLASDTGSVGVGKTDNISATVQNDPLNKGVTWTLTGQGCSGASCGTLSAASSASGFPIVYTAPASAPSPAVVTLTATSVADTSKSAATNITIIAAPQAAIVVLLGSDAGSVQVGKTDNIIATVQNDSQNKGVTWTLTGQGCSGVSCGTLSAAASPSGSPVVYTAPATAPSPAVVTLTATSVTDVSKSAATNITISSNVPPPQVIVVTLASDTGSVGTGKTDNITATVQGDSQNKGVTWSLSGQGCSGNACGTLSAATSASGAPIIYTAPATVPSPAVVTLLATSVADSSKTAATNITITGSQQAAIVVTLASSAGSVQVGKTSTITATVQNDAQNKGVSWSLTGAGCTGATCGSLSANSSASGAAITYTAPANVPSPAIVTLTATSVADTSKSAATNLTISSTVPPPVVISVTLASSSGSVQTGNTVTLTATVQNDTQNQGVTWTLTGAGCSGAACGSLSATSSGSGTPVTYTAPASVPSPAAVTVTATSVTDTSKSAATNITITTTTQAAISVTVSPNSASVQTGNTASITATVQNDAQNRGVNWTIGGSGCSGAACGSLSANSSGSGTAITYTAPASVPSPATVTLTATSVTDPTKNAIVSITVTGQSTGNVAVSISPKRAGLTTGQRQVFTANVTGGSPTTVTWEVDGAAGGNSSVGTIAADGTYAPPSSPGTHTVTARSVADSTASASATVAITDLAAVATYHNDLSRDGVNSKEYALNTSNVNTATFGKRFACAIDAQAYAQPLWVANVGIGGGTHNVVIAATQHDTVYAFDADASPCQTYWSKSLLNSGETWVTTGDVGTDDITPDIGIVGTPVIDTNTGTIYVVSKSHGGDGFHQRLHALNLSDGSEKFSGPKDITFNFLGLDFDPLRQNQRCGLALVNGTVYVAYASHGDNPVYYGWVFGFSASSLALNSVFNDDPLSGYGGIWMSGGAPAADSNGNLYMITGNGDWDGQLQFGDSFLKLSPGSVMSVATYFTPDNENGLNASDQDLGSGGAAILIGQNLLIGGGKEGKLYLLNRDSMGGKSGGNQGAVQTFSVGNAIFATPAFFQNTLYIAPINDHLKAYSFNSGSFNTSPSSQGGSSYGFPGATPSISAQGSSNGIVWTMENNSVVRAFDASNLGTELWNSTITGNDQPGGYVKFTVPTIANGKVYVGTSSEISVYGLSPN